MPSPPSTLTGAGPATPAPAVDRVVAAERGDVDVVVGGLAAATTVTSAARPETTDAACRARRSSTLVGAAVPFATTVSAGRRRRRRVAVRSTSTRLDAGAGEVVDGDVVGAAECVDGDALDAVEVHRDAADVAGEPDAAPLAETSIFSPMLEPLKSSASSPLWPSTVSLPSPGSHWKRSSPLPSSAVSAPWLPSTRSSPSPPSMRSAPLPPRRVSAPSPPSIVSAVSGARLPVAGDRVGAGEAETTRLSTAVVSIARRAPESDVPPRCRWRRRRSCRRAAVPL